MNPGARPRPPPPRRCASRACPGRPREPASAGSTWSSGSPRNEPDVIIIICVFIDLSEIYWNYYKVLDRVRAAVHIKGVPGRFPRRSPLQSCNPGKGKERSHVEEAERHQDRG